MTEKKKYSRLWKLKNERNGNIETIKRLREEKHWKWFQIARELGLPESSVRSLGKEIGLM